MMTKAQDKHGGTKLYEEQETIARNVTGVAYAGKRPRSFGTKTILTSSLL